MGLLPRCVLKARPSDILRLAHAPLRSSCASDFQCGIGKFERKFCRKNSAGANCIAMFHPMDRSQLDDPSGNRVLVDFAVEIFN